MELNTYSVYRLHVQRLDAFCRVFIFTVIIKARQTENNVFPIFNIKELETAYVNVQ